jgi:hypothetical protein
MAGLEPATCKKKPRESGAFSLADSLAEILQFVMKVRVQGCGKISGAPLFNASR